MAYVERGYLSISNQFYFDFTAEGLVWKYYWFFFLIFLLGCRRIGFGELGILVLLLILYTILVCLGCWLIIFGSFPYFPWYHAFYDSDFDFELSKLDPIKLFGIRGILKEQWSSCISLGLILLIIYQELYKFYVIRVFLCRVLMNFNNFHCHFTRSSNLAPF